MTSRAGPSGRQPPSITTWSAFTSGTGLIRSKSPKAILSLFKPHLTERQKLELATMQEVWFFTLDGEGSSRGGVKNGEFDDDDNNYILVQNEHFYYRFQLDRKIGQGGQSVVVRCLDHKTRTMVALKILASPSTSREEKHQRTELLMSMELQSDRSNVDYNVVRVLETFYFRGHKCLVMELLKAKLHCVLRQMTLWQSHEDAVRSYTRAILHFLAHTKSRGIVHGDIKPSNVLLANIADGIVRVRNFASSFFVDGKTSHVGGTLAYVAPEVLLGYPATCAVDTWSLGCTVAKLATDRELFLSFSRDDHLACCIEILGMPPKEMVEKARKRAAYFDEAGQPHCPARKRLPASVPLHLVLRGCGAQLVAFISSCLQWDPELRMTPEQALSHGWLQNETTTIEATPTTIEATPTTIEATPTTIEATPTTIEATPTTIEATPTTMEATPTTMEVTPTTVEATTIEATPTTIEATPTTIEATPTTIEATPTTIEATPTTIEATPTTIEATSTTIEATPTTIEATPTTIESTPTTIEATPTTIEATPTTIEATPTTIEATPTTIESTPTTIEATPTTIEATPTTIEATPTTIEATPTTIEATPTTIEATATTIEATPTTIQATPTTSEATPTTIEATPTTIEATPTTIEATPTTVEATPTTVEATPTTVEATPTTVEATPTTIEATPTTVEATPTTVEATPTTVETTPTTIEATPTTIEATPTTIES
ncbi:dual specificity tyrosine-phosphorylation-regulated kinase 3-like [Petromyzon marinus]|uniref:dual specificity tyrosine-phosphorylation-regulated kinase 3-like n=1 Tax=Petromyzon marinus TaxID=7757 RepID=UPI003F6F8AC1